MHIFKFSALCVKKSMNCQNSRLLCQWEDCGAQYLCQVSTQKGPHNILPCCAYVGVKYEKMETVARPLHTNQPMTTFASL